LTIDARQRLANLSDQERHQLAQRLASRRRTEGAAGIPRRADASATAPLSYAQQRFWFLTQLGTLGSAFNVSEVNRLAGPLDVGALRRAIAELVRRHESLRTTFEVQDARPLQRIHADSLTQLTIEDVSAAANPLVAARTRAGEEFQRPWDLTSGPLFRAFLWRLAPDDHLLFLCVHHIISDGWSKGVLVRDLTALYAAFSRGLASPLQPLRIQYADYAAWQQQWVEGDAARAQLAYWTERMTDAPSLQLPGRSRRGDTHAGVHRWVVIPEALTASLRSFSQREGVTPFMTLLAAFAVQLSRYSGQREVVIGSPFANRTRGELEGLIGCLMNPLPLRIDVDPAGSFRALLARVRQASVGAVAHQDVPFDLVVRAVQPRRESTGAPLFQAMLLLHNMWQSIDLSGADMGAGGFAIPGNQLLGLDGLSLAGELIYPIAVEIVELEKVLLACFEYEREYTMFDRGAAHFRVLLQAALSDPECRVGRLPILDVDERRAVLADSHGEAVAADGTVVDFFERRASATPAAPALEQHGSALTYADLNRRANRLARHLRATGVGAEQFAGVLLDRSPELITALLAVLKAGGAYVPLDPASPTSRLSEMLRGGGVRVLVTSRRELASRPELADAVATVVLLDDEAESIASQPDANLECAIRPQQIAYVIFTSGSTGRPKGVAIPHQALAAYTASSVGRFALTAADRVLQFASIAFDTAGEEIYPTLAAGATLVLRGEGAASAPDAFLEACANERLTVVDLPTAFWDELTTRMAADGLRAPAHLRLLIIGGEKAMAERALQWSDVAPHVRLLNTYGPTESTIVCAETDVLASAALFEVPIGRPVPGAEIYVLDEEQQPVPAGVAGELYIGGTGLARGYVAEPGMTAERFVPHPFSAVAGARLYRSGDRARYLADGMLEFMGRVDEQVKLRGFRIEPGEIAAALLQQNGVAQAFVMVREDRPGDRRLVGYVVPSDPSIAAADLRRALKARLPEYMVPSALVLLDELPVTTNGKVDRQALPAPDGDRQTDEAFIAPRTEAEQRVAATWREVLALKEVGADDNFFDLGGHSMLAMKVAARLSRDFAVDVPIRMLFESRTVSDLAARLDGISVLASAPASAEILEDEVVL